MNYNKALQAKLEKNLINYKILSGKFMIHETNTKEKYIMLIMIIDYFRWIYLNGKKNGKGKEYNDNGKLLFEGEYLNGKKNGKGKEYGYKGDLLYEGEYLNGKKWNGNGKINNYKGLLKYEIEYKNGKIWNLKQYNNLKIINVIIEGKGLITECDNNNEIISF